MPRATSTPSTARVARLTVIVALLALLGTACGSSDDSSSTSTTPTPGVEIADPWIRATPAGATAGAAYMSISSAEGDRLTSASVPNDVAAVTEIHETVEAGTDTTMPSGTGMDEGMEDEGMDEGMEGMGQMTMREVPGIDVPAGGSVSLEPGGYHVMLLDLVAPLEAGQTVPITLTFDNAGTVTVEATVRTSAN